MKKIIISLLACGMAGQLLAADAQWLTNFPDAMAQAKKENKLILLNFTGSDWCPPCKLLDADVLSKPEFLDYAKKNLVLVLVDFPLQKPQSDGLKEANDALQRKYEVEGYPTLIVVKPSGKVIWQHFGYMDGGPPALIVKLDEVKKK